MFVLWLCCLLWAPTGLLGHELKLVHIVFSHKFYAPVGPHVNNSDDGFPEQLDYRFFLEHTDDMVNSAKMDMYNLGVFLRERYDQFLGKIYSPEIMRMRTSEYILSMISGQLVNAGLWPPAEEQQWNDDLNWQPVVTEYVQTDRDSLLLGTLCPSFLHDEQLVFEREASLSLITAYDRLFNHISKHYKTTVKRPSDVAMLYSSLETKADQNQTLPAWAEGIFPDGDMRNVTLLSYDLLSRTKLQKQLNGGTLLKAIINETLEHWKNNGTGHLKMSAYSGEERNLVGVLQTMNLWSPHILSPGSSLFFEIYDNSTINQYTIKLIYYTGVDNDTIHLNLPGCQEFCPIGDFEDYLRDVLPIDDEKSLCHQIPKEKDGVSDRGTTTSESFNYCVLSLVFINLILQLKE